MHLFLIFISDLKFLLIFFGGRESKMSGWYNRPDIKKKKKFDIFLDYFYII